jgi:hypothetical protein
MGGWLTLNVTDIAVRVKRTFGDEAGVQIVDDDIIRWINEAQEEITNDNQGLLEATGVANIIQGQQDYSLPADMAMLRSLQYNGFHLQKLSFNEFNEYLDGFKKNNPPIFGNGIPDSYMVWNSTITLFPIPQDNITGGLVIYYIRHPTTITTFADPLTVPVQYHKAIVDYCLRQAYELDEDEQKAVQKKSEYDERIMKMNNRNEETEEYYPTITTMSDDENFGSWGFWGGYY